MDSSFKIYNASAGSGKTYTLTKAYLKIALSELGAYRKILAITFTNKAVNEMKNRILDSLFSFGCTEDESQASSLFEAVCHEMGITGHELRQRSKSTLKAILHNYSFFDVSTIDKFTHRLIRTFAKDLKLSQNFEVLVDNGPLLEEAVTRLINKAGYDTLITQVLIDFALEKTDDDKSWDVSYDLMKIGNLLFNENNWRHLEHLSKKKMEDFLMLRKEVKTKRAAASKAMVSAAGHALLLIEENNLEHTNFTASYFPKFMQKIKSGDFKIDFDAGWKQNFDSAPLYPMSAKPDKKMVLDALHPALTKLFTTIKANFNNHILLVNIERNLVPLTVLNAIRQEVKTIQTERNQLSIAEFNSLIANEIKDQPAPFIYERLGEKYRHYFIDEFQDTSQMQWHNLVPLIENALAGENGSLFLVGDAKQAIYRWRGGRAEQFLDLVNQKSNPFVIAPQVENLPANYRSHEEIIQFNNAFFTATCPILNNTTYRTLFEEGNKQLANAKKGGYVNITFLTSAKEDEEDITQKYCDQVVLTLNKILEKEYQYKDCCIIVRNNREGIQLADYLTRMEIPVISSESLLLGNYAKIRFLIHLLQLIDRPHELGLAYEILYFLSKKEADPHAFITVNMTNIAGFLAQTHGFDILNRFQFSSVFDTIEFAVKKFDLAPSSDAHIIYFLDVIKEVEQKEGAAIATFLEYWERKKNTLGISVPAAINAVQIMTVHKAKGLEFNIVIYPFAHTEIYKEKEAKLWLPVNETAFHGFNEVLINKNTEVPTYSQQAADLYGQEQQKLELDAFNVLYVALTRAVKALYVITKKNTSKTKADKYDDYSSLFKKYLTDIGQWDENKNEYGFGALGPNDACGAIQEEVPVAYQYSYKERPELKILTNSGSLWDTEREEAQAKGNLIHYALGMVETEKDIEKALGSLESNGEVSINDIQTMRAKIDQVVNHPDLHDYFKDGLTVMNEREIITATGKFLRPDRIMIHDNAVTIIDYKTGKKDVKHKEQLNAYADALVAMGFETNKKIVVYINDQISVEHI